MAMHEAPLGTTKIIIAILRASGDSDAARGALGSSAPGIALSCRDTVTRVSESRGAASAKSYEISTEQQSDLRAEYICRSGGVIMQMF